MTRAIGAAPLLLYSVGNSFGDVMKTLLCVLTTLFLLGCAAMATGPKFSGLQSAPSNAALVYVYRPHEYANRNAYPYLYIDGVQKEPIRDSGYVVHQVEPGERRIEIKGSMMTWGPRELTLQPTLTAGNRYFFELRSSYSYAEMLYDFRQVSEADASSELGDLSLSE